MNVNSNNDNGLHCKTDEHMYCTVVYCTMDIRVCSRTQACRSRRRTCNEDAGGSGPMGRAHCSSSSCCLCVRARASSLDCCLLRCGSSVRRPCSLVGTGTHSRSRVAPVHVDAADRYCRTDRPRGLSRVCLCLLHWPPASSSASASASASDCFRAAGPHVVACGPRRFCCPRCRCRSRLARASASRLR